MELPAFYIFNFQVDKNGNMYYCINQIIQTNMKSIKSRMERETGKRKGRWIWHGIWIPTG